MNQSRPIEGRPLLAVDTSSSRVSVALCRDEEILEMRELQQKQSSRLLLPTANEMLQSQGLALQDLGGLVALRGPGSFTGLRVGLATLLGLHQATGLPAVALSTLRVLAYAACKAKSALEKKNGGTEGKPSGSILAVVDALRGDFYAQSFAASPLTPELGPPQRVSSQDLPILFPETTTVTGFAIEEPLGNLDWPTHSGVSLAVPLAPFAASLAVALEEPWDSSLLAAPLYLRAPLVTLPKRKK